MNASKYKWFAKGDLNAFFALMLDNVQNLVILTAILIGFGYPAEYIFKLMIPGTALGVLIGDVVYTIMAVRLARRTGKEDVTAMPLGLDTPSTIGVAVVVLGPVWLETKDPILTWQVGMATMVFMGIIKLICSFFGDWIRKTVPDAGLIGSLAGVGLALLAFLPLMNVFSAPIVGLIVLGLIFYSLIAGGRFPFGMPGAFFAIAVGTLLWHFFGRFDLLGTTYHIPLLKLNYGLPLPTFGFAAGLGKALDYLPVAIPFGILTIVGGINVTESARLAGDNYKTRNILLTEAIATLVAGICGGVSQSTPYIGHPAYKKMGARAAYTLATGVFIGLGGCLGYIQFIVDLIPAAAVMPILLFIGFEILGQGYRECSRYMNAVSFALLPCIAELVRIVLTGMIHVDASLLSALPPLLKSDAAQNFKIIEMLGRGFIVTAMLWGAAASHMIDRRLKTSAVYFFICALFTSFGLIHSASIGGGLYLPWLPPDTMVIYYSIGYLSIAAILFLLSFVPAEEASQGAKCQP
ncbi:MAG: hypothetical protein HYT75_06900 [Deltaproteobacteria bacterium]|nr:hypothetical protein [Deltaproteobacteria bacterium]